MWLFYTYMIMKQKQYISYFITELDGTKQEMLIAMLDDFGFDGFEQMDNGISANAIIDSIDEVGVEAYLAEQQLSFTKEIVAEQNWNEQWEQSFEPIVVGDFCSVRAAFHQPVAGVQHEIIITPKMSFGTGHHATTYMMMQAMQGIDFTNKTVTDYGTGTGILAILAEKMGAIAVEAIDYDDWCIENGTENIAANNCHCITLQKADSIKTAKSADIILANINKNVILDNLGAMRQKLKEDGLLLLSGLLAADELDITAATVRLNLHQRQIIHRNGWICILFSVKQD